MINNGLVLSIFPGIDGLGLGFKRQGYQIVWGPDLLWGWDIRDFHPPAGVFEGVIGGPPCKGESNLAHLNGRVGITLEPEYRRIVAEAQPDWWVMEAVIRHEAPFVVKLSPRYLGEKQSRKRYFHSNINLEPYLEVSLFEHPDKKLAVLAGHGGAMGQIERGMCSYPFPEMCELQGFPPDMEIPFFTRQKAREAVGNAVPLCMAESIAKAVKKATQAVSKS